MGGEIERERESEREEEFVGGGEGGVGCRRQRFQHKHTHTKKMSTLESGLNYGRFKYAHEKLHFNFIYSIHSFIASCFCCCCCCCHSKVNQAKHRK